MPLIKLKAKKLNVQKYYNPKELSQPDEPIEEDAGVKPRPRDIKASASSVIDLLDKEFRKYDRAKRDYNQEYVRIDGIQLNLMKVHEAIISIVNALNLHLIIDCKIPYKMLTELQKVFRPTREERRREVINRYRSLRS